MSRLINSKYICAKIFNPLQRSGEEIIGMHYVRPSVCLSVRNISCPCYNLRMHW